jgi:hypothetical protein
MSVVGLSIPCRGETWGNFSFEDGLPQIVPDPCNGIATVVWAACFSMELEEHFFVGEQRETSLGTEEGCELGALMVVF